MEDHKSEIENWELGAGIYISFYWMRNSLQGDTSAMTELVCQLIKKDQILNLSLKHGSAKL